MIWVALLAIVALIASSVAWAGVVRWLIRQSARERELLLNQIMHLSGRTWTPPPADDWEAPVEPADEGRYVTSGTLESEDF